MVMSLDGRPRWIKNLQVKKKTWKKYAVVSTEIINSCGLLLFWIAWKRIDWTARIVLNLNLFYLCGTIFLLFFFLVRSVMYTMYTMRKKYHTFRSTFLNTFKHRISPTNATWKFGEYLSYIFWPTHFFL